MNYTESYCSKVYDLYRNIIYNKQYNIYIFYTPLRYFFYELLNKLTKINYLLFICFLFLKNFFSFKLFLFFLKLINF